MIAQDMQDALTDLLEIRREITRVNRSAGQTVFNPALTQALEEVIQKLKSEFDV